MNPTPSGRIIRMLRDCGIPRTALPHEIWGPLIAVVRQAYLDGLAEGRRSDTPAPKDGWRPIEEAPKEEGDLILACREGSKVPMVTDWDSEGECWFTFNLALETGQQRREPGWTWRPTHWMPLPVPPDPAPKDG